MLPLMGADCGHTGSSGFCYHLLSTFPALLDAGGQCIRSSSKATFSESSSAKLSCYILWLVVSYYRSHQHACLKTCSAHSQHSKGGWQSFLCKHLCLRTSVSGKHMACLSMCEQGEHDPDKTFLEHRAFSVTVLF